MKKFFLFRKEEINVSSVTASDSGQGLSVLALPADSLAFASADRGSVILVFNSATKYEESNLTDGESIEKTTVRIPCKIGEEVKLIESILAFIVREGGKSIMKFDAVDQESTFSPVSFDSKIEPKVHINPTKRVTGEPSTQTFIGSAGALGVTVTSTSVAGIDFGIAENQPLVDYNHEGLATLSAGDEVGNGGGGHSWDNGGTGGATYDISSNVGTPIAVDAKPATVGSTQKSVRISPASHLIVPTVTVQRDYTIYLVIQGGANGANEVSPIYGSADTQTLGPTIGTFKETDVISKFLGQSFGNFSVRHDTMTGHPATMRTQGNFNNTVDFKYIDSDVEDPEFIIPLVIRRDKHYNMYMYNGDGDLVAQIPAKTPVDGGLKMTVATDGRTDGDLVIERLGTLGNISGATLGAEMHLARFGVIEKDIGSASCSKLANDLFNFYKV